MKKGACVLVRILLLCMLVVFSVLIGRQSTSSAAEPIRMGMIASITGWGGFVGTQQRDAALAVADEVNRNGGVLGRPIEVLIEDDKSDPTVAVIATTKLVRDRKVVALIGPTLPDPAMAMMPTAEQEHVPYLCGAPVPGKFEKWVFHIGPSDETSAEAVLDMAIALNKGKRIAIIYEATYAGKTGIKVFNENISHYPGASLVARESFEKSDASMIPQMTKIKAIKPDVLVVYAGPDSAATLARNYKQLGMTTPVVTAQNAQNPELIRLAGQIVEESGWIIPVWKMTVAERLPADDPYRKNIYEPAKKLFQDKYGKDRQFAAYHAPLMDSVNIISAAMKLGGSDDRAAIRDALEKVKYDGLICPFACTPKSHRGAPDAKTMLLMGTVKHGEFVPYTP